ncbi:MAG: hypothetical protein RIS64_3853 [Bacteroidota bacterium]|jgi:hypothetical protein
MNKILKISFIHIYLIFNFSCKHEKIGPMDAPSIVSFSREIQPILNQHCNTVGCHFGTQAAGRLNLESSVAYAQLMKSGKGYIDTLMPTQSVLYSAMNSTSNPMPPKGKLEDATLALILKWIAQKASNN